MSSKHRMIWLTPPPCMAARKNGLRAEDILVNTVMVRAVF